MQQNTTSNKVKDPVCGMSIDKNEAAATSNQNGTTFYFCAEECKRKFEKSPSSYGKKVA